MGICKVGYSFSWDFQFDSVSTTYFHLGPITGNGQLDMRLFWSSSSSSLLKIPLYEFYELCSCQEVMEDHSLGKH